MESRYIHKPHNVSVLMYHLVCAAKYRRVVMSKHVDEVLRRACVEIEKRWEIRFLEIGLDRDHTHFLIQSVPTYSPTRIVTTVKSMIAREVFAKAPEVKDKLWGANSGERILHHHGGSTAAQRDRGVRHGRVRERTTRCCTKDRWIWDCFRNAPGLPRDVYFFSPAPSS